MSTVVDKSKVPWWVANLIVPFVNLILALLVSGLFIFIAGENPIQAVQLIIYGSFGYIEGFAYTLYYTTNFIFTGLAFAVAFHCRLFNIYIFSFHLYSPFFWWSCAIMWHWCCIFNRKNFKSSSL